MQKAKLRFIYLFTLRIFIILLCSEFVFLQSARAQTNLGQKVVLTSGLTGFKVTRNTAISFRFTSSLTALSAFEQNTAKGFFSVVGADGYASSPKAGNPALPVLNKMIEVPLDATIRITIIRAVYHEYSLKDLGLRYAIIPTQLPVAKNNTDPNTIPFLQNQTVYSTDSYGDTVLIKTSESGIIRGSRIMRLEITPVLYNPVTQKLKICTQLEAEISYSIPKTESISNLYSPFFEPLFNLTANHTAPSQKALITAQPVTYVIVAPPLFKDALQPFVRWKTKKGFNVIEAYTDNPAVGNTSASIKAYLKNLYLNPPQGMSAPSFLLIAGDVDQIAPFHSDLQQHVTDLYFAEYTGDKLPELFYGRFPAANVTELQTMINKTLEYEQYSMPDPSYLGKAALISGADQSHQLNWSNGQIRYASENYFNASQNIDAAVVLQPSVTTDITKAMQYIASGVGFANYTAHCSAAGWADPRLNTNELSNLQNDHKYMLMIGNCCQSGKFDQDCLAKAVMKLAGKGAIGYIGGSDDTYWDEDFWWSCGFKAITGNPSYDALHPGVYDGAFHTHNEGTDKWFITMGQLTMAGNLAVEQSNSTLKDYYWEVYNLMGDPSLSMYYGIPKTIQASYQPLLPIGSTSFLIQTEPNAYAAVSMNGKLYGAAIAGADGVAVVKLNPITEAGDADVVVTMQNRQPKIGTLRVDSPQGAYLLLDSYTIHDVVGNNDGFADYGEEPMLNIKIKNFGQVASGLLTLKLTSDDPMIVVKQPKANWGSIATGALATLNDAFTLAIDSLVTDKYIANLTLEVTDGTTTWKSRFTLPIRSRNLEAGTEIVNDAAPGNGNGLPDPGETFVLRIPIINSGQSGATGCIASISSDNQYFTISNSSITLGYMASGAQQYAEFSINAATNAPIGTMGKLTLVLKAKGKYNISKDYVLSIGKIGEDFEANNFDRLPWEQSGALPWVITNANPQQGTFCARSGAITHAQSSTLSITFNILRDGQISFYRKVSSEAGYDRLLFYIDDRLVAEYSGQQDWEKVNFDVVAGQHSFRWTYLKDGATSVGSDCAWIDNIVFPQVNTAPLIRFGALVINDDTGNKNGQLDPGENVTLVLPVDNNGLTPSTGTTLNLTCNSPYITLSQSNITLGDMVRGTINATRFNATVSSTAPKGAAVDFEYKLTAGNCSAQKGFTRIIGNPPLVEDFEKGNFTTLNWLSGGNKPWIIENTSTSLTGKFSARSGAIGDLQNSDLLITLEVVSDDSIRFWLKTSTEKQADYLKFFIDNQEKGTWSSETDWSRIAFAVGPGIHTFKWSYQKDYSNLSGSDAVWIDNIQFPPVSPSVPLAILAAVDPVKICQSESAVLSVKASGGTGVYSYSWKPSTGLDNPLSATPITTPSASTAYTVEVNDGNVSSSATVTITVLPRPDKPAITISTDGKSLVSSSLQGNQWYKETTLIQGATNSSYTPTENGKYYVRVIDYAKCQSDLSDMFLYPPLGLPEDKLVPLLTYSPNPFAGTLNISYTLRSATPVSLMVSDITGRCLKQLVYEAQQQPATYQIDAGLGSLQNGVYLLILKTKDKSIIKRVVKN
ncbi:MAG: T9SS type A sorting domain-containing protein [Bacteroidetes bacterium]|nr:T9SS type A sorting domain-containing protein [Bacteroidota bacterium]